MFLTFCFVLQVFRLLPSVSKAVDILSEFSSIQKAFLSSEYLFVIDDRNFRLRKSQSCHRGSYLMKVPFRSRFFSMRRLLHVTYRSPDRQKECRRT